MDFEFLVFSFLFLVLLTFEWLRNSVSIRILVVLMAIGLLAFSQPSPRRAARNVVALPQAERITKWPGPDSVALDDYTSGVVTMERAMVRDISGESRYRWLATGALVWLAISPLVAHRRRRTSSTGDTDRDAAA